MIRLSISFRIISLLLLLSTSIGSVFAVDNTELLRRARAGDVSCMRMVARKLYDGIEVPRDIGMAITWWKRAAAGGDAASCNMLGDLYRKGSYVKKNLDMAYALYLQAHRLGSDKAEARIAKLPPQYMEHYRKTGGKVGDPDDFELSEDEDEDEDGSSVKVAKVRQEPKTSSRSGVKVKESSEIQEIRQKAEKGDAMAQYELGMRYNEGNGVPKSRTEALKWLRKAEAQGSPYAKAYLEEMK